MNDRERQRARRLAKQFEHLKPVPFDPDALVSCPRCGNVRRCGDSTYLPHGLRANTKAERYVNGCIKKGTPCKKTPPRRI